MLAMQFQLERSQWWRSEDIEAQQLRQLRELAGHALANVAYYRDLAKARALPAGAALTQESLRQWPILRKRDVLELDSALNASAWPKEHGRRISSATTGSSGHPVRLAFTEAAQFVTHALVLRNYFWHELDFSGKLAVINPHLEEARGPDWGLITGAAFRTGPIATLGIGAHIDRQLEWLCAEDPAYLQTRPTNLRAILRRSRELGLRPRALRAVITQSEMLHAGLRELARETWAVPIIDTYSCGEFGLLALQCPRHDHYHVQSESVFLEVLDEDGAPCPPGAIGRVVVTSLHNFAMPLIRYELGDYAEVGAACACGRGLPTLKRVVGRVRNLACDPTGRRFWPSFHAPLWLEVAPFHQIRLLQRTPEAIEVEYVMARALTEEEQSRMRKTLQGALGYPFDIRFNRVAKIGRAPEEKFEDFVSLVPHDGVG